MKRTYWARQLQLDAIETAAWLLEERGEIAPTIHKEARRIASNMADNIGRSVQIIGAKGEFLDSCHGCG